MKYEKWKRGIDTQWLFVEIATLRWLDGYKRPQLQSKERYFEATDHKVTFYSTFCSFPARSLRTEWMLWWLT